MNKILYMSEPGKSPLIAKVHFKTHASRVFRAWTDPEEIPAWFGRQPNLVTKSEIDLTIGGQWRFAFNTTPEHYSALTGQYTAIEIDRHLSFTWRHDAADHKGRIISSPTSTVSVDFIPDDNGTQLILQHEGLSDVGLFGAHEGFYCSLNHLINRISAMSNPVLEN